jgi:hypothetical protein
MHDIVFCYLVPATKQTEFYGLMKSLFLVAVPSILYEDVWN